MRILLKDLRPSTHYLVQLRSVDYAAGRWSAWSRMFDLETTNETTPPMPVTNLAATFSEGNLSISWTAPTLNADGTPLHDLKDYQVEIGPAPADPEWRIVSFFTEATAVEFTKEANVAAFGHYRPGMTITVRARDILDNPSAPATLTVQKPRPNPPTGLVWQSVKDAFSGSWAAPTTTTAGTPLDDLAGYEVKVIYAATNIRTYNVASTSFNFSYEENKATFGGVENTAKTPLTLEVRAKDSVGQLSDPVSKEAGNAPPAKPTGVTGAPVSEGIRVTWNGNPEDDIIAYEIWSAGTLTGAGTLYGRVGPSQREYIHQTVAYSQDHYLYVTAVDEYNSRSPESDRTAALRPKSPFTVDTQPPPATTLTAATATRPTTQPAAVNLSWPAVTASDLAGYHIRFSKNTATREWLYHDVIDKAATKTAIEGLASATSYVFQIRSYDTMINPSAWSAEATATSSTSILKEVVSEIQIVPGGVLRSSNFNETNQTGWRLMDSGLDILSGRVNARVISAGTLISSQPVTVDGTTQPAWSLNLAGNASLNDVQVRGKIVVGAGTGSAAVNIASANYGGTGNQWAIKGDGTMEFKGGSVGTAGAMGANTMLISSTVIEAKDAGGNTRVHIASNGLFTLATSNGGLVFDNNGLRLYSGATLMIDLNRSGNATFAGEVKAATGHIGNWQIADNGIHANNLSIRSDLGMIFAGLTTSQVAMRAGYGFWAGSSVQTDAPFYVLTDGSLYSKKGVIGGWTINATSLSGSGTISGGKISGTEIVGGSISSGGTNRVVIAPNDGIDVNFYSNYSDAPGYIDTRARLIGSALNKEVTMTLVPPRLSGFTTRPSIQMFSREGTGNRVYYHAGGGNHRFTNTVFFDVRPYIDGIGNVETQGHGVHGVSSVNGSGGAVNVTYTHSSGTSPGGTFTLLAATSTSTQIRNGGTTVASWTNTTGKPFVIQHPTQEDKYLQHACIEGPTVDVYYRGEGRLNDMGEAIIKLPDYFEELTKKENRTIQLTPMVSECGCYANATSSLAAGRIINGQFVVKIGNREYGHRHIGFYWEVKAERKGEFVVEPSKADYELHGDGPYTYLMKK